MGLVNIKEIMEKAFTEVEKTCPNCKLVKPIARINAVCEDCIQLMFKEEKKREEGTNFKLQRIPERYWKHEITEEHKKYSEHSAVIFGDVGTGKTHYACQVLKLTGGRFYSIIEILESITKDGHSLDTYKRIKSLCIDDFTKVNPTDARIEKLFELFVYRYRECKHTIITCDMPPDEIEVYFGKVGGAIRSRIKEWMIKIKMTKKWR